MVLVGEHDKLARDVAGLQHIEHCQAFRYRETIIKFTVDDLVSSISLASSKFNHFDIPRGTTYQLRGSPVTKVS
jgi:prephenate dehydrogenase